MTKRRWPIVLAALLAGLLLTLLLLQRWVASEDFRARTAVQLSEALGVPVVFGSLALDVWPLPALALVDLRVQSQPPLVAKRIEVRVGAAALLAGRFEVATLLMHGAELPQAGLDDVLAKRKKGAATVAAPPAEGHRVAPHRVVLESVTWRGLAGEVVSLDGDARLAPDGWPEKAAFEMTAGPWAGTRLRIERQRGPYQVQVEVASGTISGEISLLPAASSGAPWSLQGQLETRGLALAGLSRNKLSGTLQASTTLSASAMTPGGLLDGLQTQSRCTVQGAVVHGVDLARAVKTIGMSRGGETRLDTLGGLVVTRGRTVALNNIAASSGLLSASGNIALSPARVLSGRVNVNLGASVVGDTLGVPLLVGGTLDAPEVTLTRAAMLGAAIGTAVLPGVGTGAGAALGDKVGGALKGLFGK